MRNHEQGFTFIELMTVVALIGFFAAVAVPAYTDYVLRSQTVEGMLLTINVKRAIGDYYAYHGKFPKDNKQARISPPEQLMGNVVSRVEVSDGNILVTFGSHSNQEIAGKTLSFRPQVNNQSPLGSIVWQCGKDEKTTVEKKYLSSSCK
jgi:type IV pilus assembly protein PilA